MNTILLVVSQAIIFRGWQCISIKEECLLRLLIVKDELFSEIIVGDTQHPLPIFKRVHINEIKSADSKDSQIVCRLSWTSDLLPDFCPNPWSCPLCFLKTAPGHSALQSISTSISPVKCTYFSSIEFRATFSWSGHDIQEYTFHPHMPFEVSAQPIQTAVSLQNTQNSHRDSWKSDLLWGIRIPSDWND